jgi:hypothetical protein
MTSQFFCLTTCQKIVFINEVFKNLDHDGCRFEQRSVDLILYKIIVSLNFIHGPAFLKHNVLKTIFCLCLQVKPTHLGPRSGDRD